MPKEHHKVFQQADSDLLVLAGTDVFGRDYYLLKKARDAFFALCSEAQKEAVFIEVVSAFRSYDYQAGLIEKKLAKGDAIDEIKKVVALPGFSEHHTGCALDLTSKEEVDVLNEEFENTAAFRWLCDNAEKFRFYLSYPRGNSDGYIYEPWHWCYRV
ncbi:MAG: M15 family metallopeptidase [Francisellaceae bacterium]